MAWVAVAIGGSALVGGLLGANASQNAANTEANAANNASQLQSSQFNTINNEYAPYRQAGTAAMGQLSGQLSSLTQPFSMQQFQQDPGYQFQLQQGNQALQRSAAARGLLNSTGTMRDLSQYNQGLANTDYQQAMQNYNNSQLNRYNMLAGVSQIGAGATGQVANAGQNMANSIGQNMMGAANASAAGAMGTANAYSNALGNGMNTWMNYNMMNKIYGS